MKSIQGFLAKRTLRFAAFRDDNLGCQEVQKLPTALTWGIAKDLPQQRSLDS